ncbi:MAG: hypothetical protein SF053_05635 [Bacteroidia bacterium]|nr:hypothetical protein [Bacteroidia bacterium]
MKLFKISLLMGLAALSLLLNGCIEDSCKQTMTYLTYEPVYKSYEEIRNGVGAEAPRDLRSPGKMYFKDSYIFISETDEGIHVINNQDPSNPQPVSFIRIPGVHDLAIRGDILYADSYMDLLAINIADLNQVTVAERVQNVFPFGMWHQGLWADPALGVAVDFIEKEVTEEIDCGWGGPNAGGLPRNGFFMEDARDNNIASFASNSAVAASTDTKVSFSGGAELSTGIGGSMARFTIVGDFLYAVTPSSIIPVNISSLNNPVISPEVFLGWNIETVFPYENKLFIGSTTGMIIYGLDKPDAPNFISIITHMNSCDPVVVEGDYAYVTLRDGTTCNTFTNQLDVVNISNVTNPRLEYSYPMTNPHGLGIRDGVLFICDGAAGLKIYDAADPGKITANQLAHFPGINTFDVIPLHNVLLMIGDDGLYQYDYSDLKDIKQLSLIPVVK